MTTEASAQPGEAVGPDLPDHDRPNYYVGIGASAGGLEAIEAFFKNIPSNTGMAFIVIQHLSPDYKSLMVELLSKKTTMAVLRAEDGMVVRPNQVYLIPPGKVLTIFHGKLLLAEQTERHGPNLPIDVFLRSLADDQADRAVAVILSGTGSDGTRGVRVVKEAGGMVMVQDEQSAKFDGMPRSALSTGVADFVAPPHELPEQLLAYAAHPYASRRQRTERQLGDDDNLTRIFAELRKRTKVDFTYYKPSTITRRIERRMTINRVTDLAEYARYLRDFPGEVMTLYRELLIGVTSFFRDREAFEWLAAEQIPRLLLQSQNREMRFWVAGCSTGEEAYTFAILTRKVMEHHGLSRDVKIFATDLDRDAVMTAGNGVFPESIAADLSPDLLGRYFYRTDDHYRVARNVREMVVFAQHNLVKDPPFTNIDLVSCRNLLIYLQPVLQQKALEMFNFSLNPGGVLFLGSSETVGEMSDRFETLNQKHKIFRSRGRATSPAELVARAPQQREIAPVRGPLDAIRRRPRPQSEASVLSRYLAVLAELYVPCAVIVNEDLEVLHTTGDTSPYFKVPSGLVAYEIGRMAPRELAIPLATGVQKVFRTREPMTYTNVRVRSGTQTRTVRMRLLPLPDKKGHDPLVAVFLEELHREERGETDADVRAMDLGAEAEQRLRDLEQELQFSRENLQATIEELETANEELQATNEELLASNEELQSTNEELQSTNEELHTVNSEYQKKITELTELNNDVDNLLTHSRIGTLLLDENLEIRKYSPAVTDVFKILQSDVGRPITHLAHRLSDRDPVATIREVQASGKPTELEVVTTKGRRYLMRVLPYRIGPHDVSGLVVSFVDVTALKRAEDRLESSRREHLDIVRYMPAGLFVYTCDADGVLRLEDANPEAQRLTGVDLSAFAGRAFDEIWPGARETGLAEAFEEVVRTGESYRGEEVAYDDGRLAGAYRIRAFRLPGRRLAVSFEDITERRRAEAAAQESEAKYRALFETMAQGVVYQEASGSIVAANPAAERILGLSKDQMLGRTSMDPRWRAVDADGNDLPGAEHPAMVSLRTGEPVRGFTMGVYSPRDEALHWLRVSATPEFRDGETRPWRAYATFEEISDTVEAQRKLARARDRFDFAFSVAGLAWWDWNVRTGEVEASPRKAELVGLPPTDAARDLAFWTSRIHPDDHERAMAAMREHLEGRAAAYEATYRIRHEDGSYVLLDDRGQVAERDAQGAPLRVLGTVRCVLPEAAG